MGKIDIKYGVDIDLTYIIISKWLICWSWIMLADCR